MKSNLPPGVSEGQIPGNGSECEDWESLHEWIDLIAEKHGLEASQVKLALEMGIAALEKVNPKLAELNSLRDDLAWGYLQRVEQPNPETL
jgi:hypothetical protein